MKFTVMIIDDEATKRRDKYKAMIEGVRIIGQNYSLDPVEIKSEARMVEAVINRVQGAHLVFLDIFLDTETNRPFTIFDDGKHVNILEELGKLPHCPPIFIASDRWGDGSLKKFQESLVNEYVQGTINLDPKGGDSGQCSAPNNELVTTQIEAALVRSMGGIALDISPNEDIQMLHLSDLHMGARWNEGISTDPQVWEMKVQALKQEIDFCCSQPRMNYKRPSLVVVTGDITQTGSLEQFADAQAFMGMLLDSLHIPKHACFICPGNHDVFMPSAAQSLLTFVPPSKEDRNPYIKAKAQSTAKKGNDVNLDLTDRQVNFAHARGLNPGLCNFRQFFHAVTGKDEWSINLQKPQGNGNVYCHSGLFSFHGLNIFGLNTVNELKPENFVSDTELHSVHAGSLAACMKEIQGQFPNNLNILFSHHPIMRNGLNAGVCEGLIGSQNLILFGHRHKRFEHLDTADNEDAGGFIYSCAPSVALRPGDGDTYFEVGFNTVTIKRDQGKPKEVLIRKHTQCADNKFKRELDVMPRKLD